MSKLGKKPIDLPKGVDVKASKNSIEVKGPKGVLTTTILPGLLVEKKEDKLIVSKDEGLKNSFYGLYWALIKNMIVGVENGYEKRLKLIGVGFRAQVKGDILDIQVGFSHPTIINIPKEIQVKMEAQGTEIVINGIDKQRVGQFAADVRQIKPPEPYKGKGIRYKDEYVRKKAGKSAAKGG